MTAQTEFVTSVVGLRGTWPDHPTTWSHSSLEEVGQCPRKYALRRATYPDLWDGPGYPDQVWEASIFGDAVHLGVETLLRALHSGGCTSVKDEQTVELLRGLGGYSAVASRATAGVLADLESNPRMAAHLDRLADRLNRRIPEMRSAMQTLVSRTSLEMGEPTQHEETGAGFLGGRRRIGLGSHPEVTLESEDDRFTGRVDLLTVKSDSADVVDYKTGKREDHHDVQVTLYGLLWFSDRVANPDSLPVGTLKIAYITGDESVAVPEDWEPVRQELLARITEADRALAESPPHAHPSDDCSFCSVRHMCDEFWNSEYGEPRVSPGRADVSVEVIERNGPRSWIVRFESNSRQGLLRVVDEEDSIKVGQRLRILGVALSGTEGENGDDDWMIATTSAFSETYPVEDSILCTLPR